MYVHNIIKGIIEKDIESSLKAMQEVLDEGKDLSNFLWEMIKHTKDILMYKVSKKHEVYSEEETKQIAEISEKISKEELINIIYKLSELENKMKLSSQKTIIFETEIIKLCMKEDTLALEERIEKLEKAIKTGKVENGRVQKEITQEIRYETPSPKVNAPPKTETKKEVEKPKEVKTQNTQAAKASSGNIITNWQVVLGNLKKQGKVILYANLVNTDAVEINDMTVVIKFYSGLNSFREKLLKQPENMNVLTKEIAMACGKPMQIKFEDASGEKPEKVQVQIQKDHEPKKESKAQESEEDILNSLDIPINIMEEE